MKSLKKTAAIMTVVLLCGKLFGFAREMILAFFYGTSYITDAYLMAEYIPSIIFGTIIYISVPFTPIYIKLKNKKGPELSNKYTSNLISTILLISLLCSLLCIVFSDVFIRIVAPGFNKATAELTNYFFKRAVWYIAAMSIAEVFVAYLNCNEKFIFVRVAAIIISFIQMIFILVSAFMGYWVLAYSFTVSYGLYLIVIFVFTQKNGYKYKFQIKFTPEIKETFQLAVPIVISSTVVHINSFVDKYFASLLAEGNVSAMNYSYLFKEFIFNSFSMAIITIVYPYFSKFNTNNDIIGLKNIFIKAINIIVIIFMPITVGVIIFAKPIISVMFQRGNFLESSTNLTAGALVMYSIGLLPQAIRDVIIRVFYVRGNNTITMMLSILNIGLNIIFNVILTPIYGLKGIAFATSSSLILTVPIYFILLNKEIGKTDYSQSILMFAKSFISAGIMGFIVYLIHQYSLSIDIGNLQKLAFLVIGTLVGAIAYYMMMVIFKVQEVIEFKNQVFRKITNIMRR